MTPQVRHGISLHFFCANNLYTVDAGDYVIVSDALQVRLTGKKATDKVYYHHTGFMGGLKKVPITRLRERRPEEVCKYFSVTDMADCSI